MEKNKIRLLRADEIEVRVDGVYDSGVSLLLYKDARTDQNILDETFGMFGWKKEYMMLGDAIFCSVSVRDPETGEFISKADVGSPTFAEPTKGAASDAFKRACFNWGVGRELYSASSLFVPIEKVEMKNENGKKKVKDRFYVTVIEYDEEKRIITGVEIKNKRNETVCSYGLKQKSKSEDNKDKRKKNRYQKKEEEYISAEEERELLNMMNRKNVSSKQVCTRYLIDSIDEMNIGTYERVMRALKATPDAA